MPTFSISLLAELDDPEAIPAEYWIIGGAVGGLLLLVVIWRMLRRRRAPPPLPPVDLSLDVSKLESRLPKGPVALEMYNLPVRLAAVVLAPTGRGSELGPEAGAPELLDYIVPGLAEIMRSHQPVIRRWPAQLSTQGFSNTLFANVRLPGDRGKGTPWSIVAGRFETGEQNVLAGLVLCTAAPNSLGQLVIDRPGQWLDILRVRRS